MTVLQTTRDKWKSLSITHQPASTTSAAPPPYELWLSKKSETFEKKNVFSAILCCDMTVPRRWSYRVDYNILITESQRPDPVCWNLELDSWPHIKLHNEIS